MKMFRMIFLVMIAAACIAVLMYVLYSYSLYKMAVAVGMENAWLAWIPLAQIWVLCNLSKEDFTILGSVTLPSRDTAFIVYLVISIVGGIISRFDSVLFNLIYLLCVIAAIVFQWRMYYDAYKIFGNGIEGSSLMALSIFSAVISIVAVIAMLMYHNNTPELNASEYNTYSMDGYGDNHNSYGNYNNDNNGF